MKLLLLTPFIVIVAAFIGQSVGNTCYPGLPMWHSCVGTTALDEGTTYTGTWEWNVATGEGTLQRTDGSSYTGEVADGRPYGEGVLTLVNGDTYTGDFADGQRSGMGTETSESGESYTGRFENDRRHGQGQLVRENRDIYTGEFANGEPHGRGVLERAVSGAMLHENECITLSIEIRLCVPNPLHILNCSWHFVQPKIRNDGIQTHHRVPPLTKIKNPNKTFIKTNCTTN